jgi:hypothetical protein
LSALVDTLKALTSSFDALGSRWYVFGAQASVSCERLLADVSTSAASAHPLTPRGFRLSGVTRHRGGSGAAYKASTAM